LVPKLQRKPAKTRQKLRLITLQFTETTPPNIPARHQGCAIGLILRQQLTQWCRQPRANRLAVAYSGGLDSSVLVHALAQLNLPRDVIEFIHIDHGLNSASAEWAEHCRKVATALGFAISVLKVQVQIQGTGIEDAARRARYRAIAEHIGPNALLLTAHHQADQAETVLIKILSGAGPRGAVGMAALSVRRDFLLGRPLLNITKSQIRAYAERHNISWVDDPSNLSPQFQRNRIRQLLPELCSIHPDALNNVSAFAEQAQRDRTLLEAQAARGLARCVTLDARVLAIGALNSERTELQPWIVRAWLDGLNVHSPELEKATLKLARGTSATGEAHVRSKKFNPSATSESYFVRRFNACLYFEKLADVPEAFAPLTWCAHTPINLPGFGTLHFDALTEDVARSIWQVSLRCSGERIQLPGRLGSTGLPHQTAIKDILQQHRIPPWQRRRRILLAYPDTGEIACVVGICISARFHAWLVQHATRLVHNN
jgi:tRNA(Ile)-lysidine synthase